MRSASPGPVKIVTKFSASATCCAGSCTLAISAATCFMTFGRMVLLGYFFEYSAAAWSLAVLSAAELIFSSSLRSPSEICGSFFSCVFGFWSCE